MLEPHKQALCLECKPLTALSNPLKSLTRPSFSGIVSHSCISADPFGLAVLSGCLLSAAIPAVSRFQNASMGSGHRFQKICYCDTTKNPVAVFKLMICELLFVIFLINVYRMNG